MSCLWTRVANIAQTEPHRPALVEGARSVSYGELWRDVRSYAASLVARGLTRGGRVAVVMPNCIEAVVACYATWLAGGVVVPLNAQARTRDLTRWLSHCGARIVVREETNADLDEALALLPSPSPRAAPGDLAMILYTSGTTGQPKGVMLSHDNVVANADAIIEYLALSGEDSVVAVLPFYYSYGASVLHTHLAVGARIILEHNLVFPHLVVETMARERVSGFSGVPSTFALLLARVDFRSYDLSSLRYVTQAGGAMTTALVQRARAMMPRARFFVMYGQTEATARLTWLPPERLDEKLGSVGVPVPGMRLEIRHEGGGLAEPGEVGEVWVSGRNVMLGFLNDDAATAAAIQNGWLKTGDMGRVDHDGFLFLSGRRSDMIKTGAHRVHPSDIEDVIAELGGVMEVAVVGVPDAILGEALKAFVVTDGTLSSDRVRVHCRRRLASFKVPRLVEIVPGLPKTASGKIQRARLLAPEL